MSPTAATSNPVLKENNNKVVSAATNNRRVSIKPHVPVNPVNLDSKERAEQFLNRFDYILTDCDGVLYVNNDAVLGVPQTLNKLRKMGKKIIFATNNSTKTREEFMKKLKTLGYEAEMDELFPTSYATAVYLESLGFKQKVFVVGMNGISKELAKVGIESFGVGSDPTPSSWTPGQCDIELEEDVGAVVIGFDNQISFPKLARACSYVKQDSCLFIASNADETYPHPDKNVVVPGPGAYVAAIEAVTGKEPIALGKPYTFFFDCIKRMHPEIDPKRTVMIGDRLTTDMVFGRNNGLSTLFVQSGLGTLEEMNNYRNSKNPATERCVPDFYLESLADLSKYLQ
jgi:phosphoglycolate phosphatase